MTKGLLRTCLFFLAFLTGVSLGELIIMKREPPAQFTIDPRYNGATLAPKFIDERPTRNQPPEPSKKAFLDAFLGITPPGSPDELQGNLFVLPTNGDNTIPGATIQNTMLDGEGCIRIEVADEATIRLLTVASNWDVQLSISEGVKGASFASPPNQQTFTIPRIRIPVKGKVIAIHALSAYAHLFNNTGGPQVNYAISFAILPRRPVEDTQLFENNSGGAAPIAGLSHHFSVSVPGGVQAGDLIEVRSYAGSLLKTYPAREGGVWAVGIRDATVTYVPLAGVVSELVWTFYRTI